MHDEPESVLDFNPFAEALIDAVAFSLVDEQRFRDDHFGQPRNATNANQTMRNSLQARMSFCDGFCLVDSYIEFGKVLIRSEISGATYWLKSANALPTQGRLISDADFVECTDEVLHIMAYDLSETILNLSVAPARIPVDRSKHRFLLDGNPESIGSWSLVGGSEHDAPQPFEESGPNWIEEFSEESEDEADETGSGQ